jgi:hypothetical protein
MTKILVLCFVLGVFFVPAFLLAASCDSEGAEYYITFTLEGVEYSCTFGYTDVETNPFATDQSGGSWTFMAGVNSETTVFEEPSGDYAWVEVYFDGSTIGTFTAPGEDYDVDIWIAASGEY